MMKALFRTTGKHRAAVFAAGLIPAAMIAGGVAWACADSSCYPDWKLGGSFYSCGGQAAMNPTNDTRINMVWLMQSLSGSSPRAAAASTLSDERQFGQTFMSWPGLRATFWPSPATQAAADTPSSAPSCQIVAQTLPAFRDALAADTGVPEGERKTLNQLREKVGCGDVSWDGATVNSAAGRYWLAYLKASQAFYANDWATARQGFAPLARARNKWIAETAAYMPIRIALRASVAGAVNQYGDFAGVEKVDAATVGQARTAIAAYLKAYPKGRYADSAKGLTRRVAWLSGDDEALAHSYETLLAATPGDREDAADLAEEIDIKLFERQDADALLDRFHDLPLLTAIGDLKRMRRDEDDAKDAGKLSAEQLAAQQGQFAAHPDLYGFLQATRALQMGENPRSILAMVPDAAHAKSYTPLAFSRQMLRGRALAKAKDPNEAGFWQGMLGGATAPYQRPLVEMGLVLRWQRDGRLAQVFAPGSPITDSMTRQILLQTLATPAILRDSARDASRPAHERDIARFTLLYKDLTNGAYADFGSDVALAPNASSKDAHLYDFSMQEDIPVGLFRSGQWSDGKFPCGSLTQTAAALARSPVDRKAQLCLAEFYRLNGFDGFSLFRSDGKRNLLGAGASGFPGRPLSRDAIYAAVIADQRAAPDERAYALYRAVMCYAPSGYNGCATPLLSYRDGATNDVPKTTRKVWYDELKQRYPGSPWAKSLRYYW